MKVRFKGNFLEDEKGERVEVSYKELLKGCLDTSFETISISKIIFKGVAEVTSLEVIRTRDYGKMELYRRLEREIQEDVSYQQAKATKTEENLKIQQAKNREAKEIMLVCTKPNKRKYIRKKYLAKMRPYKNYHRGSH